MAESDGDGGNRTVMQNAVRVLSGILVAQQELVAAINALAPTTVGVSTVAGLPAASVAGQGARRAVTDANSSTFGTVVVGGGLNFMPVISDGNQWRLG